MSSKLIKSISFSEKEHNIWEYANSKESFSKYVKALIKTDMNNGNKLNNELKEEINKYIFENFEIKEKDDYNNRPIGMCLEACAAIDEIFNN